MEPHSLKSAFVLFLILIAGGGIIAFLLYEWGRITLERDAKREKKYLRLYDKIEKLIAKNDFSNVNELNIKLCMIELERTKHIDFDMTDVLKRKIQDKFHPVDEFSVESIFAGE
jgi:hypothetical protein